MVEPQIDTPALIATSDKSAASQARKVFRRLKVADRPERITEFFRRIYAADGAHRRNANLFVESGTSLAVLLLDIDMPDMSPEDLISTIRASAPDASTIVLASDSKAALEGIRAGADDYVMKPLRVADLAACFRVLEGRRRRGSTNTPTLDAAIPHLVERLHDPSSGQLDAKKTARFFGLTVAEVARVLGRGISTVHKTPTAPTLQERLRQFEAMASGLLRLTGSPSHARMWLHASDPALDGHAPVEWLRMGKVKDLASYIQDLLEGRPA